MKKKLRLGGCIIGGAIGDAWGCAYENVSSKISQNTFYLGKVEETEPRWSFTDDTQLTLITLEALLTSDHLTPETLASYFVQAYIRRKITGIGASTLKAFQELEAGGHWSQVGRSGEYAAGNGAAMRIAPFAFYEGYSREDIRNFCRITHRNDEAYAGALAVVLCIQQILSGNWKGEGSLVELIIPHLPDTRVRDRLTDLVELRGNNVISDAAKFGTDGYVVNSIPFAIVCASQVSKIGIETMFEQIIHSGGDTDTNASIAGQIAGALIEEQNIPVTLKEKLASVPNHEWLTETVERAKEKLN